VTLLAAALLGIVQGVTEFLPVSSTAHLLLVSEAIGFQDPGGAFTVMIQLGSILAVVWIYRVKLTNLVTGLSTKPDARKFAAAIVVATIPALVAGALFAGLVKRILY
jgi:undecaprenyl-diphosphatase